MKIAILAPVIFHDRLGALRTGRVVEVPDHQAKQWIAQGAAEHAETKELRERPCEAAGTQQSASPVAPASTQPTSKPSRRGGKDKRAEA